MNTIIRLAKALAYLLSGEGVQVHEFPGAYQVVVNGDVYCWNEAQGWFRPDGNYAPKKTGAELQERLNLAMIHVANIKAGHATPKAQPTTPAKPKPVAKVKAQRRAGTPAKGNCRRCGGDGVYKKPSSHGQQCWNCNGTGTYIPQNLRMNQ